MKRASRRRDGMRDRDGRLRRVGSEHPKFAGGALPVVSLAALLATDSPDDGGLGPAAREVAGRFTARGG
jgi:hypothetical protein